MTELEIREKRADLGDSFRSGVLILTLSAVIVKIIGLIYKIPMLTLLGSEGMGYFNSAYEIYTLFGVVSTAGLPVAMSVLISRARCGREMTAAKTKRGGASAAMTEERIFSASRSLFLAVGAVGSLLMLSLSPLFSLLLGSRKVIYCIAVISPTVLFICIVGVYRGFFQGLGRMRETAISQVIEAVFKLAFGLILAYVALRRGYSAPVVAAFGVMGLVLGIAMSALYLALSKRAHGRAGGLGQAVGHAAARTDGKMQACGEACDEAVARVEGALHRQICRELLAIAVPIALSSAVISVTKIIDMTVILRRMQDIGHTAAEAFSAYGGYTTLALPLFSLAPALTGSVALPLVPSLSSCVASGDREGQVAVVSDALRLTSVLAMPISLGLSLFSREILTLIFVGQEGAVALCAPLLSILALSVPLACFITVENAVLQAYSSATLPIISMLAGSAVKIILAYFLIGNSDVGIAGAPISTFFCDLVINAINLGFIARKMPRAVGFSVIAKPFLAAFIAVGGARLALSALAASLGESNLITIASIALCALIYLPISLAIGATSKDDLLSLKRKC